MSYHHLPVALDLEKSFLWPHTSTEPLPPSFFHPVSLEVSFHIPSPFPPLLASESTPFGGFLAFKPDPSCKGPWHPAPHLTDLSLSVLHISRFNTGAHFLLSTSFCYWKWHPAACCSEANTSDTVGGKESYVLFWRPATGGEGGLLSKGWPLPDPDNQWVSFKGEFQGCTGGGRGLHAETAWSALPVILKLDISGLISTILTVFST